MTTLLSLVLALVFLSLALIHFNWVIGGEWGLNEALPTNEEGQRILNPRKIDSAVVGLGLSSFACYYLIQTGIITIDLPSWFSYLGWIIPAIFVLRAIGEFKYLGFFKRIKGTKFADLDSKFYSPLCLMIGLIGIIVKTMI